MMGPYTKHKYNTIESKPPFNSNLRPATLLTESSTCLHVRKRGQTHFLSSSRHLQISVFSAFSRVPALLSHLISMEQWNYAQLHGYKSQEIAEFHSQLNVDSRALIESINALFRSRHAVHRPTARTGTSLCFIT